MSEMPPVQRLRITFGRGEEIKYISHLDLMRLWERGLRRAEIPLAYSEGYSPHPKISLAAPLPVGVTSEAEIMDIFLEKRVSPMFLIKKVSDQLPHSLEISEIAEVALMLPSLQSLVCFAEYRVEVETHKEPPEVQKAVVSLLAVERLPWQRLRNGELRKYDLRSLIDNLWLVGWNGGSCILGMRLRCGSMGAGRVEDVVSAFGFERYPHSVHRTELILAEAKSAVRLPLKQR